MLGKKDKKKENGKKTEAGKTTAGAEGPKFAIQRLYIKDISFKSPESPKIFLEEWKPEQNMNLAIKSNDLGENNYEVILTITLSVKFEEKEIFLAEVNQAGVFNIQDFSEEQLKLMLGSFCPNILYPYAREVVTDVVSRGSFPQLYLTPINFDALYKKQQEEQAKQPKDKKQ